MTGVTDNGARISTLVTRGFVSLYPDEGNTAAWQLGIFAKSVDSGAVDRSVLSVILRLILE